ncbi:probable hexosyltransferase MUCI70 [Lotus japonicus]|uniref:probable hexosyltransferase MUCI70 n=1 Tax=Lotus japonicus TaxID=34305 RepID=UPI00258D7424|nr:probable hexosyltransferase MUCI70 [Lotus japonicus]XP_057419249.1 probable hexosyltransferase MUCI70 [Lotus japonicus]XP_057419250.1 probable hexosyltransferase MUCI70 [Lotus japonicus]
MCSGMALYRNNGELFTERRGVIDAVLSFLGTSDHGSRVLRRGRRFGRITKHRLSRWVFVLTTLFSICLTLYGLKMFYQAKMESRFSIHYDLQEEHNLQENTLASDVGKPPKSKRRKHFPCEVGFLESVNGLVEPKNYMNFTWFSLEYVDHEEKSSNNLFEPRFGGHQSLEDRENSFYAKNQTIHCGFVKGPPGYSSTGFDLDEKDKAYMFSCKFSVSSCIFGSSDFLRRPTSRLISQYSKENVCFVMFMDDQTLSKLSSEGNSPDDRGYIGLWKVVVVKNLPYEDMRRTGKVPKFLSHRLFPNSRYSIWLDSKMRLTSDPMLIIEYFLWRRKAEYAISNHYDRHSVWEEVLQNKRLNKYNHTAIDEQFNFYQSDGFLEFDPSSPNNPLPSYVPEGSLIVRAHTPMSNLFSCLWFNEVDRFTSRDQLSFAYTYLKLKRMNPERLLQLYMFKDCERRALVKLFRHRAVPV